MDDVIPVKVAVRVRPFNSREKDENAKECTECYVEQNQIALNGKMFAFDCVFDALSSQEMVFEQCAGPLVERLFKGYNCTIFAYGQTGSGKTYTMGTEETMATMGEEGRGIIPRIVDAIFSQVDTLSSCTVTASMLEIYEEKVIDLLSPDRENLQIREQKGTVFVQNLSVHVVKSLADTMIQLEKGCQLRSKGETAMNDKSSRSHAVFTITIEAAESEESGIFKSKLHLVDLAGSERLKKTQAEGERMREGIKINEGLLALGNVIAALAEPNASSRHIPYRVSKITRLLQDSLGGNSYTVMIACVSPADTNAEETISTLRYADRAKRIKNKPVVNVDPNVMIIQNLREELANLRNQLAYHRAGKEVPNDIEEISIQRWEEMEKELCSLKEEHRRLNMRFAESVAENSIFVEKLTTAQQTIEKLKEAINLASSKIKEKGENGNVDDILEVLNIPKDAATAISDDLKEDDVGEGDYLDLLIDQNYPNCFAEKQQYLNREVADVIDEIRRKETAVELNVEAQAEIERIRIAFIEESEKLQSKLEEIEKEKNDLLRKLKGTVAHHKISEERRRRLQELEKAVATYKRRIMEIKKIENENLRVKEQAKKLASELADLKKLRVKLSRHVKEEEVKFRNWKRTADREYMKLKTRERKREIEAAREVQASKLQLAVYRRKYEEANACNRRLQQQLTRCTKRYTKEQTEDQLTTALEEELAMAFSVAEAQVHCDILIEQRKTLSLQQKRLRNELAKLDKEPPNKRRTASDRSSFDGEAHRSLLEEEIKNLGDEIELRGSELGDIRSKCVKAHLDERCEQRWNDLHTLAAAKIALKHLFDATVNEHRLLIEKEKMNEELRRLNDENNVKNSNEIERLKMKLHTEQKNLENLRKTMAEKQVSDMKMQCDMVCAWNGLVEGRVDKAERLLSDLNLLKLASERIKMLEEKIGERKREKKQSYEVEATDHDVNVVSTTDPDVDQEQLNNGDENISEIPPKLHNLRSNRRTTSRGCRYSMLLPEAPLNTILATSPSTTAVPSTRAANFDADTTYTVAKGEENEKKESPEGTDPLSQRLLSIDHATLARSLFDEI